MKITKLYQKVLKARDNKEKARVRYINATANYHRVFRKLHAELNKNPEFYDNLRMIREEAAQIEVLEEAENEDTE